MANRDELLAENEKRIAELERENKALRYLRNKLKNSLLAERCRLRDKMNDIEDYIYDLAYGKPPIAHMLKSEQERLFEPQDELQDMIDKVKYD